MRDEYHIKVAYRPEGQGTPLGKDASVNALAYSLDVGGSPKEGGNVRMAWNEQGLFVHADLEDSFIVATDRRNEQLHFETGDVFELFVKPLNHDYYWELYATPFGNRSTLFFPRERTGMTTNDFLEKHAFRALQVSAAMTATGWTAELFVPATQLSTFGEPWGPEGNWTVLCGRYNYNNEALEDPELSMLPPVSATNYHLTAEYAVLDFNRLE